MTRYEILARSLAQAERIVALGRSHIEAQRRRVAELRADGHDARRAEQLLSTFQESQSLHEDHRNRLKQELGGEYESGDHIALGRDGR